MRRNHAWLSLTLAAQRGTRGNCPVELATFNLAVDPLTNSQSTCSYLRRQDTDTALAVAEAQVSRYVSPPRAGNNDNGDKILRG